MESIQEHERVHVQELKPGEEIGFAYAESLVKAIADKNGVILVAKTDGIAIGFVCAYIDVDHDPLLGVRKR